MRPAHVPVLLREVLEAFCPAPEACLLDGTLGLGGHAIGWLEATEVSGAVGSVVGLDRDSHALSRAQERLEGRYPGRTTYVHASYEDAPRAVATARRTNVDAALLDLGASSLQFDTPERGFSLQAAGPIDMRMDTEGPGPTAADLVNESSADELERIFREYGDEPGAARIARAIVDERRRAPFRDTLRLAEAVAQAVGGRRSKLHPATRVFQGLRVAVNDEMGRLDRGLPAVAGTVRPGGVLGVISFQRHEDRRVKHFLDEASRDGRLEVLPSVVPGRQETRVNPRSRSARLRLARLTGEASDA
jgi:16S rRNA (cytosine1402-N4)-methyltransferase